MDSIIYYTFWDNTPLSTIKVNNTNIDEVEKYTKLNLKYVKLHLINISKSK